MRVTCETLRSGQPRAYADTIRHVRVTFELQNWDSRPEAPKWIPRKGVTEEEVRAILPYMKCGFTDFVYDRKSDASAEAYFRTRLDWLRKVSAGVWEFHTTSAFTD